jgi:hypothetical protein
MSEPRPTIRRPVFDWTINLGHILTFVGFVGTGFVAFQSLDKRLVVVEQQLLYQQQRDAAQDAAALQARADIREALRDVHASLEKLNDKLSAGRPH